MKEIYMTPTTGVVKIKLIGSVLETVGVDNTSKRSEWSWAAAKHHDNDNVTEFDEETTPMGTVGSNKSIWDD